MELKDIDSKFIETYWQYNPSHNIEVHHSPDIQVHC